ncbi:TIGR02221 family CRISPR-associated protein [Allofranklinella schreckenbergeri]|uniref:TIGR02221 family CRISPR-associated protein n=1 Tax=Allofranklinella schreckenbergeri TaxID=1076744 RepID=A0A3M6QGY7_9BURK|nr:TIGR02221 family CRISPR-associated protein [Allofranklinella schreckenbergeri]RMX01951.1 TIGR02221 family CRISPR-associated protein [Allofranklinella schreckenbergeri]
MTTLISLLGKSQLNQQTGYRSANYRFADGTTRESPYFGLVLAEHIKADKLILIGTRGSMWDIFFDHQGSEDDTILALVDAVRNEAVTPEMLAPHQTYVSQKLGLPVECHLIPYARNEQEQAAILTTLANAVQPGETVVLDVTHGFRHLPMLALVAARYLRHVRQVQVQDVYYGALEMTDLHNRQTPVLNLGGMLQMLDWVEALAVYENSGNYGVFAPLFEADGMAQQRTQMLSQAAYFERGSDPVQAAQNITGAFRHIQEHQGALGTLFSNHLTEHVGWFRQGQRPEWELALADRYLERKDYLRAIIYLFESRISRAVRDSGGDINDYDARDDAREDARANPDFKLLGYLRNAMTHGVRPFNHEAKRLLQNERALAKELQRLRKVLFK